MKQKQGHYNAEGQAKIPWRPSAASSDLLWKIEMSLRTKAGMLWVDRLGDRRS